MYRLKAMRISIRQQLALLLLTSSLVGLAVLAIAFWVVNHNFVVGVASNVLRSTATYKAEQVALNLELMQIAATFLTTKVILQQALQGYNNGSATTTGYWDAAITDLESTLGYAGSSRRALVLQAEVFPYNFSGPAGKSSVVNATGVGGSSVMWTNSDGSDVYLGKGTAGYPPDLYPNLTVSAQGADGGIVTDYEGVVLSIGATLVLGPLVLNETFSLLSMTMPMVNNSNYTEILGWVTAVMDARLIQMVQEDQAGLGKTGKTLLVGPPATTNLFPPNVLGTAAGKTEEVQYLLPINQTISKRHPSLPLGMLGASFNASSYPGIAEVLSNPPGYVGSMLRTHDEANKPVSAAFTMAPTDLVDWLVVVELSRSEVWSSIHHLRTIILACLFAVAGFWLIASFPIAYWAVLPIIRLRAATEHTIEPRRSNSISRGSSESTKACSAFGSGRKRGFVEQVAAWRSKHTNGLLVEQRDDERFRIPSKVPEKKNPWIKDEMTDLVHTFNGMTDELHIQYSKLEERVQQRTIELEHSKKVAEAANKSKTIFVANVSHELKTPLNGILGMCAVCMEEDDLGRLKQSLGIIYKSGDLLLRTLSDLLTFSTNQVGHQAFKLDEKEFCLRDLESQVHAIFGEQAKDRQIHLQVNFEDSTWEAVTSRSKQQLRDIVLWGDIHRILQIGINLISNALKFTPADGSVTATIRTLADLPPRRDSYAAKSSSLDIPVAQKRRSALLRPTAVATANFIDQREIEQIRDSKHGAARSVPPGRDVYIELEVRDTGPGIEEEMQQRIFEPFVQGDVGLNRKYSGTGLGLSICSQLATLMRGTISLSSEAGKGSVFRVKLPLRQTSNATGSRASEDGTSVGSRRSSTIALSITENPREPPIPVLKGTSMKSNVEHVDAVVSDPIEVRRAKAIGQTTAVKSDKKDAKTNKIAQRDFSKVRVLVAEDNKVNQEVITRMLKLEKISNVTVAEDGQQALDLVKTKSSESAKDIGCSPPFDLVFMDIQMPHMDGITSTKLIREFGFKAPIIALTAFAEQSNVDGCLESGMDHFLAKPVRRAHLREVLTEYCSARIPEAVDEDAEEDSTNRANDTKEDSRPKTSDGGKP